MTLKAKMKEAMDDFPHVNKQVYSMTEIVSVPEYVF